MARLILVSNRVAVPGVGNRQAGGLTVAINATQKLHKSVWFGWSGEVAEGEVGPPRVTTRGDRTYIVQDLSAADHNEYYNGFANQVLWPVLHYRLDLAAFNNVDLSGYQRVNRHFAQTIAAFAEPDDLIWVHDYHLLPLARELRALGLENAIGFFLHVPCPPPDIALALPQHADTLGALGHYDLVGTQTERDAENLGEYFINGLGASERGNGAFQVARRRVQVRAFPVSIATGVYARAARIAARGPAATDLVESLRGQKLILGVDRLDYTKGIPDRIRAFGHFLEHNPQWRERVTFLQLTPKSRSAVQDYLDLDREVSTLVGSINGTYGCPSWTPIRYVNRGFTRGVLAGLYRAADVGLVTPLRDGMNLVAKEYIAAQDPENPGVLVLSQFAGAAERMQSALLVNPHEPEAVAAAILTALEMDQPQRHDRWLAMFNELHEHDIDFWAEDFLSNLAATRPQGGFREGFMRLFSTPRILALAAAGFNLAGTFRTPNH
jgi:trehalose 6-phosphate synthase